MLRHIPIKRLVLVCVGLVVVVLLYVYGTGVRAGWLDLPQLHLRLGALEVYLQTRYFFAPGPGLTPMEVQRDAPRSVPLRIHTREYVIDLRWGLPDPSGKYPWRYYGVLTLCTGEENCNLVLPINLPVTPTPMSYPAP
jgi:hypothetical protein